MLQNLLNPLQNAINLNAKTDAGNLMFPENSLKRLYKYSYDTQVIDDKIVLRPEKTV